MCKSVRGAAFFGSSLHLAFSFVFMFWFIFDTIISEININLWKCEPPEQKFSDLDPLAHYLNLLFKLIYFIALCVTGVYIFRGVERERPRILKFAALGFIILQIIGVILFSVFFSIQWNTEPDLIPAPTFDNPEASRLVGAEDGVLSGSPESQNMTQSSVPESVNVVVPDLELPKTIPEIANTVTPMVSENVLPAPDLNDATTTTPIPSIVVVPATNSTTTTTPTPATTKMPASPCSSLNCPNSPKPPPPPRRRLPHNQLVSLVFQICLVIANGIGSVAYVIVLALYMVKL